MTIDVDFFCCCFLFCAVHASRFMKDTSRKILKPVLKMQQNKMKKKNTMKLQMISNCECAHGDKSLAGCLRNALHYIRVARPGVMHNCLIDLRVIRPRPHRGGHTQGSG